MNKHLLNIFGFCNKNVDMFRKRLYNTGILSLIHKTKVPHQSVNNKNNSPVIKCKIGEHTICLLEQLSLIDCENENGIKIIEDAVEFAEIILYRETDNVEPMYTVLGNRYLTLRSDEINEGYIKKDILKNSSLIEEDYFVAPPGNIPIQSRDKIKEENNN